MSVWLSRRARAVSSPGTRKSASLGTIGGKMTLMTLLRFEKCPRFAQIVPHLYIRRRASRITRLPAVPECPGIHNRVLVESSLMPKAQHRGSLSYAATLLQIFLGAWKEKLGNVWRT